jgi:hypothetical protein
MSGHRRPRATSVPFSALKLSAGSPHSVQSRSVAGSARKDTKSKDSEAGRDWART